MTTSNGWEKASKSLLIVNIMLGNSNSIALELNRIIEAKKPEFVDEVIVNAKR